jgi:hypothetical protein
LPPHAVRLLEALHGERHAHIVGVFVGAGLGRHAETLPDKSHLRVDHAQFEDGAIRDEIGRLLGRDDHGLAGPEGNQLLPQCLELRLVGLETPEISGGIRADGDRFDDF